MVHPLTPFAMRGGIWYQGESNGNEGITYYQKKHALVNGWRKAFQNKDLAFYWVQLANFQKESDKPEGGDGWAKLREAQTKALDIPGTGMAVITDIGAANDIHPKNKQDVGWRLAQWALHQTYGQKNLVPSGPLYKSHKVEGNKIRLSFDHAGSGLIVGKKTGLEPTEEVKDGISKHSKGKGPIVNKKIKIMTLEGAVVRYSDIFAYFTHDLDDALRSSLIKKNDIPVNLIKFFGSTHSERISKVVSDTVNETVKNSYKSVIISSRLERNLGQMRDFLFQNVYHQEKIIINIKS